MLLVVDTMSGLTSISLLWKASDINLNVGGACGEIVALGGKYRQNPRLVSPVRGLILVT
jgi:chitin synthase